MKTKVIKGVALLAAGATFGGVFESRAAVAVPAGENTVRIQSSLLSETDRAKLKSIIEKSIQAGVLNLAPSGPVINRSWSASSSLAASLASSGFSSSVSEIGVDDGTERLKVALTASGLDRIASEVVPTLANEAGLGDIEVPDVVLAEGRFDSLCDGSWKLKARDITLRLPVDSNDLRAHFQSGNKLDLNLNQDGAYFSAEVAFVINAKDACIVLPDEAFDLASVSFSVRDLDLDLNLGFGASGDRIVIHTIHELDADIGSFTFGSSFLNTLVDFGFSVAGAFGSSCGTIEACINQQLAHHVADNEDLQDKLLGSMNDALNVALSVSGASSASGFSYDYQIALASLSVDDDRALVSTWDASLSRGGASVSSCASLLTYTKKSSKAEELSYGGHIDAVVPLWLIEKGLYLAGQQAYLCPTRSGVFGGLPGATYSIAARPEGMITVLTSSVASTGTYKLNVPLRVTTGIKAGTVTRYHVQNITASVTATTVLSGGGLKISLGAATATGFSGSVSIAGTSVDISSLKSTLESALNAKLAGLNIPVLPRATDVGDFLTARLSRIETVGGPVNKTGISAELTF